MAKPIILLLAAALSILYTASPANAATTSSPSSSAIEFIKASCSATLYPALCAQSLSRYATSIRQNRSQLIKTAFSVSLDEAQSTKAIFANKLNGVKPGGMAVVKDCIEQIGDAVDQLRESIEELKSIGRQAKGTGQDLRRLHISNAQTWTSAALTDISTCTDAVAGEARDGGLETSVRARVDGVAQVTSNALALLNKFGTEL